MKKLIRDNYATIIEQERLSTAGKAQRLQYLKDKVNEELKELAESNYLDPLEYGDVIETIYAIGNLHNITNETIDVVRKAKKERFGGFEDFLLLELSEDK